MDIQEKKQLEAKYYNILVKIEEMPISEEPSIEDLPAKRKDIQAAYRDVKKYDLDCSLMDFFGWVSALMDSKSRNALRLFNFNKRLYCNLYPDYEFLKKINELSFEMSYAEITSGKE